MFALKLEVIQSWMMFAAYIALNRIIIFPVPELATDNSVIFGTSSTNELSAFFAPCYSVEMSRFSADAADESPMPIAPWIIAFDLSSRFA
jgi:hypothetical protein